MRELPSVAAGWHPLTHRESGHGRRRHPAGLKTSGRVACVAVAAAAEAVAGWKLTGHVGAVGAPGSMLPAVYCSVVSGAAFNGTRAILRRIPALAAKTVDRISVAPDGRRDALRHAGLALRRYAIYTVAGMVGAVGGYAMARAAASGIDVSHSLLRAVDLPAHFATARAWTSVVPATAVVGAGNGTNWAQEAVFGGARRLAKGAWAARTL